MAYQVLSLKWRPRTFEEVIGQNHVTQALSNAIKLNRVSHAFTFSGPRGVGKTTTARILAANLNKVKILSESLDIIEMDAASNRGIDEIRNLRENINYAPAHGKYKIYIIDEVHMLTKEAFNALLKTLEEPPEHVVFILATTELHKMPETIISRTQRYDFKRLISKDIVRQMKKILNVEKIKYDEESLMLIANKADGSMRDALSILDQMICYSNDDLKYNKVKDALGIVSEDKYRELLKNVGGRNTENILLILNNILNSEISISDFISGFNQYLRDCMIAISLNNMKNIKILNEKIVLDDVQMNQLDILRILELCLKFQINIKKFKHPDVFLESLMVKLSYLDKTIDIQKFLNREFTDDNLELKASKIIKKNNDNKNEDQDNINVGKKSEASETYEDKTNFKVEYIENKNEDKDDINVGKNSRISEPHIEDINFKVENIENKWSQIIKSINNFNSKIAIFLEKIKIVKIENNILFLHVFETNRFSIKALNKDKNIIEKIVNEVMGSNFIISLSFEKIEPDKNNNIRKDISKDEEHPLFMDVLNKFKGEVIK